MAMTFVQSSRIRQSASSAILFLRFPTIARYLSSGATTSESKSAKTVLSDSSPLQSFVSRAWFDTISSSRTNNIPIYKNYINGSFTSSDATSLIPVTDPATNEIIAYVPHSTEEELEYATTYAQEAFESFWKKTSIQTRQRVMLSFQALIRTHQKDLAHLITAEQGKTLADGMGDVFRGLEVVESACGMGGTGFTGESLMGIGTGIDCHHSISLP